MEVRYLKNAPVTGGQVESCKRDSNRVLLTKDKLCAMYAMSQGVKVIFMNIENHVHPRVVQKLSQYTFTIIDPTTYTAPTEGISGLDFSAYDDEHIDTGLPIPDVIPVQAVQSEGAMFYDVATKQNEWDVTGVFLVR